MVRVAIRADASPVIGTGHVRRTLALATALRNAGAEVVLIARDLGLDVTALAARYGVAVHRLPEPNLSDRGPVGIAHGEWAGVPQARDASETAAAVGAVDHMIIDHYGFDADWHHSVAAATRAQIAVIDDLADRPLGGDIVIDHNYAPDGIAKYADVTRPGTPILIGPDYALIDDAYARASRYAFRADVASIGVFLGGIDLPNLTARVLDALGGSNIPVEVATTSANPHLAELQQRNDIRICVDLHNLADFFARHDLQVGAGGGAIWERCCLGAPTLCLVTAENQRLSVPFLDRLGVLKGHDILADPSPAALAKAIFNMIASAEDRHRFANASRQLVDGKGAARVARAILGVD